MSSTQPLLYKVLLALVCLQSTLLLASAQATGTKCPPVAGRPGCVCDHPDGRIDISPLANSDNTPRFTNMKDPNDYTYTFNPCNTYSTSGGCTNVFLCQRDKYDDTVYYDIADAGTEEIYTDTDGSIYLYYTSVDEFSQQRYSRVYLQCDTSLTGEPQIVTEGDSGGNVLHYVFYLKSDKVCPGGASAAGGGDIAGPIGLVLIFVFLAAVVAYFVVGAIIMKVKFQATGTDIIPNKAFWFAVPLLIKDGFLFTFGPCVSLIKAKTGRYEKA